MGKNKTCLAGRLNKSESKSCFQITREYSSFCSQSRGKRRGLRAKDNIKDVLRSVSEDGDWVPFSLLNTLSSCNWRKSPKAFGSSVFCFSIQKVEWIKIPIRLNIFASPKKKLNSVFLAIATCKLK